MEARQSALGIDGSPTCNSPHLMRFWSVCLNAAGMEFCFSAFIELKTSDAFPQKIEQGPIAFIGAGIHIDIDEHLTAQDGSASQ
jgi:hypothetical protein